MKLGRWLQYFLTTLVDTPTREDVPELGQRRGYKYIYIYIYIEKIYIYVDIYIYTTLQWTDLKKNTIGSTVKDDVVVINVQCIVLDLHIEYGETIPTNIHTDRQI